MKRTLLAALLATAAMAAHATGHNWVVISADGNTVADTTTIAHVGDHGYIWIKSNFNGHIFISREDIGCSGSIARPMKINVYDTNSVLVQSQDYPGQYTPIQPNSILDSASNLVCGQ